MISGQTDWTLKLHAYLHDPFEKPLILFSERHAVRAGDLVALLGLAPPASSMQAKIRTADHYASAMNRLVVETSQTRHAVDFLHHPLVVHPLSGESYDLREMGGTLAILDEDGVNRIVQGAKTAVEEILREMSARYGDDPQRLFLALWRLLPGRLRQSGSHHERLGHLWTLLPADSRVPDHSIWDHLSTTSAMVTALDQPAFLLFTLGPVQEFIATARRTQDLWMGSFLLSYLTWQAIQSVAERFGPDSLMFPSLFAQPLVDRWLRNRYRMIDVPQPPADQLGQPSLPNRFLTLVPAPEAEAVAETARTALMTAWREIAESVKGHVTSKLSSIGLEVDGTWQRLWHTHIESCFETYWVVVPWGTSPHTIMADYKRLLGIEGTWWYEKVIGKFEQMRPTYLNPGSLYAALYDLTERALGSRKTLRAYHTAVEEGYKCTLCGIREALHPAKVGSYQAIGDFWKQVAASFPAHFPPEGRERLCAVCLTKRLAVEAYFGRPQHLGIHGAFPSTSTMAIESFRAEILQHAGEFREGLDALATALRDVGTVLQAGTARPVPKVQNLARREDLMPLVHTDGRWFFKEGYAPEVLAREYGKEMVTNQETAEVIQTAKARLQALLNRAREHEIAAPSTYYAVVYMDGDRMGEWLSGEHEHAPTIRQVLHPRVREALYTEWQDIIDERRPLAPSLHTAVSNALRVFSQEVVRPIVEAHCGMLVYAGGDDVIAFFPLRHVLSAVWDLRRLYSGHPCQIEGFRAARGFIQHGQDLWPMLGGAATASAGVAIVHHLHPLSQGLAAARDAEHMAKGLLRRNAFAVNLLKLSGERLSAGARFTSPDGAAIIEILEQVIGALREKKAARLSSRLMYQLSRERILGTLPPEASEAELARLIKRHIEGSEGSPPEPLARELTTRLTELLQALWREHGDIGSQAETPWQNPFELFANLLLLTRFIAMEGRE